MSREGNAIVEFIGWSAVLVVPVLYLVVTLAQLSPTTSASPRRPIPQPGAVEVDDSPYAMDNAQLACSCPCPVGIRLLSVTCAPRLRRIERRWSKSQSV